MHEIWRQEGLLDRRLAHVGQVAHFPRAVCFSTNLANVDGVKCLLGAVKYGLVRDPAAATPFPDKIKAGMYAARAGTIIMRLFEAVELG